MRKLQINRFKKISLLAVLLLFINNIICADTKPLIHCSNLYNTATSTITVGTPNASTVVTIPALGISKDSMVTGIVNLKVNYQKDKYEIPYNAEVSVTVITSDVAGTNTTNNYILKVSNQPYGLNTFTAEDTKLFSNQSNRVYKIATTVTQVKINGIVTNKFPNNLTLENKIEYLRYDNFVPNSSATILAPNFTPIDLDCNGLSESIQVNWLTATGAVEYQLEWAFINDYDQLGLSSAKSASVLLYDFKNNSTRITTSETHYTIPIIADRGYFIARVRGVGRSLTALATPIYGQWTVLTETGNVGGLTLNTQRLALSNHFESNKNWQYNVTFAEEGKHKDVISYFDGSLRNRQSITQISTDTTTIVGETIYDFTGRGAISVLPTPLAHKACIGSAFNPAYSFNYIPNFNMAAANYVSSAPHSYTKKDFDLVDPANSCSINTSPMVNTDGASKYYSPNNPEKNDQQAFIPDANEYPFTQVEYTPDNTGRIRKQGGVGVNHQLGSNHETKYFYSVPTQIELDRLFGSEVGNAAHYQKHMVIDANGQISISYMDMAGKTIATALAGSPPPNLDKLSSAPLTAPNLTADLFNKDANGVSVSNKLNTTPDAIEFNSTFLVTTQSINTFTYNFSVDTVGAPCLKSGICFSCVYDLDIKIIDECGSVLYSSPTTPISSNLPITPSAKLVGNFTISGSDITFNTVCTSSSVYSYTNDVFATPYSLSPGVYTISKTLRVNKDARDFYLKEFLKKTNRSTTSGCFKDSLDFLHDELAKIDTTDCFVNCQSCFQNLGKKDDFVAQGRGTDLEWEALYDECDQLCGHPKSKCEIAYEQMLADMSPSGQYGQIKVSGNIAYNPGAFPLSVYNIANILPKNTIPSSILFGVVAMSPAVAYWTNPQANISGTTFNYYFDKSGQRSKITLIPQAGSTNPGGYNLPVTNLALVFPNTTPGTFYTYPENLANLSDFVQHWNPNWAKSLIIYHPEYCYYQDCIELSTKLCNDTISSEDFDKKIMSSQSYNDAIGKNLIVVSGGNNILNYNMDPFVKCTSTFGPYGASLVNKYNNYDSNWGTNMTMSQFAASITHCGSQFGQNPFTITNCTSFGILVPGPVALQDSIRNQEWNSLKSLYLAEKNKLQIQRSNDLRLAPFSSCQTYNGCIGNSDFNPVASGMYNIIFPPITPGLGIGFSSFFSRPYFQTQQPCNVLVKDLYKDKAKRFGASSDVKPLDENQAAYQVFLQTGQCTNAFELEGLMNGMSSTNKLTANNEALLNHPQFTPNLYNVLNNTTTNPPTYINYLWKATTSSTGLDVNLVRSLTNVVKGSIHFDNPLSGFNWSNVKGMIQLQATGSTASSSNFKVTLKVQTTIGGPISNIQTTGNTTIILDDCKFKEECSANDFAKDLQVLLSALKTVPNTASADFFNTTGVTLTAPSSYNSLVTQNILNVLGSPSPNPVIVWKNNTSNNSYEIYDALNSNCRIAIKFTGTVPTGLSLPSLTNIISFSNIKSNYQNFFTIDGKSTSGSQIATINGEIYRVCSGHPVGISMGTCGLPEPLACRTEYHETRKDLETLLTDVLNNKKFTPTSSSAASNLLSNTLFDNNLKSKISPLNTTIIPNVVVSTNNLIIKTTPIIHGDINSSPITNDSLQIVFTPSCALTIKTNNNGVKPQMLLSNLISAQQLTGYGNPSLNGNYNSFYLTASFNTTSGMLNDTIFGYSCFDIQNCNTCADTTKPCCGNTSTDSTRIVTFLPDNPGLKDSLAVVQNKALLEKSVAMYNSYQTAITDLNTKYNWTPTDTNYVQPQPFQAFSDLGFTYAQKAHIRFINNFDTIVDSKADLKDLNRYFTNFGHSINPSKEYERYSKSIAKYNQRALAISVPTLTPIQDTVFFKANMPDSIQLYVKYLNEITVPTATVMTETQFFVSENGLVQSTDTCSILYKSYVNAYKNFVNYQQANNNPCKEFLALSPMYTMDEFIKNNYCCSQSSYLIFNQYINSFYNQLTCPQPISFIKNCANTTEIPTEVCAKNYNVYLDDIKKYNTSPFAVTYNNYIVNPYPTFTEFSQAGLCNCILDYIKYLETYISIQVPSNLPAPVAINNYTPCGPPKVVNECSDKYNQYISAVTAYNSFIIKNPNYAPIDIRYKVEQFTANGFCYCVDGYTQFLLAIVNGSITDPSYVKEHLSIADFCKPPKLPCAKPNNSDTLISPPLAPERNPCVAYKYELAAANAQLAYQQYVAQQTTDFVKLYNARCLTATENFFRKYDESEFHHTLYYYDQAGNLIRTIPPAGIDPVLFSSIITPSSTNEINIQQDRANNTHNVLTNHNLATTYLYNSLNQLVKQNLPDHDQMTYTKNQYAWGLDTNLNVVTSQFVSTNKGFLAGFKIIPSTTDLCMLGLSRGMIYETNDAGINWQPVNCPVGANIKKSQFVTTTGGSTVGFAVGSDGTFMVSYDNGNNWDLVPIHNVAQNTNFTDLSVNQKPGNKIEGFLVGEKGLTISFEFKANSITPPSFNIVNNTNTGTLVNTDVVTSITSTQGSGINYDYFISVLNPSTNLTKIYQSNLPLMQWDDISGATAPELTKVVQVRGTPKYYIGGVDGTLLKYDVTIPTAPVWNKVMTNTKGNFKDLYFMDDLHGIAIIEDLPNTITGGVYKTIDGGNNWAILDAGISSSGAYYKTLSPYQKGLVSSGNTTDKIMACGTKGLLKRITINKTSGGTYQFGSVNTSIPTTNTINDAMIVAYSTGVKYYAIAVGNSGSVYTCDDYTQSTITWNIIAGVPTTLNAKKIIFDIKSPNTLGLTTVVNGVILDNAGILYRIVSQTPTATNIFPNTLYTIGAITTGAPTYKDMVLENYSANAGTAFTDVYLMGTQGSNTRIARLNLIPALVSTSSPAIYPSSSINNTNLISLVVAKPTTTDEMVTIGINGEIFRNAGNTLPATLSSVWTNQTTFARLSKVNDLAIALGSSSNKQLIAVGDQGLYAQKDLSSSTSGFNIKKTATLTNFNATKNYAVTTIDNSGVVVGNTGYVAKFVSTNATQALALTMIPSATTNQLNDVYVNIGGTNNFAYSVGNTGKALFINNLTTTTPVVTNINTNTTQNLYGISDLPSTTNVLALGDNMQTFVLSSSFVMKQRTWFTNEITKLHFANSLNGYVVGKKGLIRHTTDGGGTWKVVKPYYNTATSVLDHYSVHTLSNDNAFIGGENTYLSKVTNLIVSGIPQSYVASSSTKVNDISFNGNVGYAVGTNTTGTTSAYIVKSTNAGNVWTNITATSFNGLNALHQFNDNTFITVGNNNKVGFYNGTTLNALISPAPPSSGSNKLNDVIFLDDRNGYIVGDAGRFFNTPNLNKAITVPSVVWTSISIFDQWLPASNIPNTNINTISFSDRYDGFIAGTFTTSTNGFKYARKIHDESGKFSTFFWYDRLGRMVVSQNTKQRNKANKAYSYTIYDELGRIKEVGEKAEISATTTNFESIFGTIINMYLNTNAIDDAKLKAWINDAGLRTEITRTYYDVQSILKPSHLVQENLRKRVASITFAKLYNPIDSLYDHATHYSYDIHGNVKILVQDNRRLQIDHLGSAASELDIRKQRFKHVDYDYDLISGKVNKVSFQKNNLDQYHHRYTYDADNRITDVETSKNDVVWEKDANYTYYKHGPLARVELGQDNVQGMDYAYTIQGWIKGVNSNLLTPETDMGVDGGNNILPNGNNNNNHLTAKDAYGYTLGYYANDYSPIDNSKWTTPNRFEATTAGSNLIAARNDLHNGNISHMVTTIRDVSNYTSVNTATTVVPLAVGNAYKYDQLNRLDLATAFNNLQTTGASANLWASAGSTADMFKNSFTYDANGNIVNQQKHDQNGVQFENLNYQYFKETTNGRLLKNRLYHVNDNIAYNALQPDDIDDQGTFNYNPTNNSTLPMDYPTINTGNNYGYDEIGNLIKDVKEEIASIKWTVYGKIDSLVRIGTSTKSDLKFLYDAGGNRIAKIEKTKTNTGALNPMPFWKTTYYVRDAQGNVMATYKSTTPIPTGGGTPPLTFKLTERDIYGSSRLGLDNNEIEFIGSSGIDLTQTQRVLGKKQYELTNHLGNVLTVVSDRKIAVDNNADGIVDYYLPDVVNATDYTAFGAPLAGRTFNSSSYRYGFNGKEKDDEIKGTGNSQDYGMRIYDPRLGRFLSVDPIGYDYPWNSTYAFAENEPISNIDLDGLERKKANICDVAKCFDPTKRNKHSNGHVSHFDLKLFTRNHHRKIHKVTRKEDIEKKQNSNLPNDKNKQAFKEEKESSEPQGDNGQKKVRDGEVTVPSFFTSYADGDVYKDKNSTEFREDVGAGTKLMKDVDNVLKTFENKDDAELVITIGGGKDVSDQVKQARGEALKKELQDKGFKGKISVGTTNDNVPAIQIMGSDGDKK
jgi:RHS repeat-associated protein